MTLLDASGVQAADSDPEPEYDNSGDVGSISISYGATDSDVTILTGKGDDSINTWFVGTEDEEGEDSSATISTGAGEDWVLGSMNDDSIDLGSGDDFVPASDGEDIITMGDGNDTYSLSDTQLTTIDAFDTITDFTPNTVGQGTGGEANEDGAAVGLDDRDGDVIDLSVFGSQSLAVEVFANASDATTFLANNDGDGELNIALDDSTGLLYMDIDDNGFANSVIELQGVTDIDEAAFSTNII